MSEEVKEAKLLKLVTPEPEKPEPNERMIEILEMMLNDAKEGSLESMTIMYQKYGDEYGHTCAGTFHADELMRFCGLADLVKQEFLFRLVEMSRVQ